MNAYRIEIRATVYDQDRHPFPYNLALYFSNLTKGFNCLGELDRSHPGTNGLILPLFGSYSKLRRDLNNDRLSLLIKPFGGAAGHGVLEVEKIIVR